MPSARSRRYFTPSVHSVNLVDIPSRPATIIQNVAPGPPRVMATATPAIGMSVRQQPWSDDAVRHGRILVLSDNPISRAIAAIASTAGRTVVVETADDGGPGLAPGPGDAVVLCDHDAPTRPPCCVPRWPPRRRTSR